MWKSNLIIALRMLGRNKTISLINIAGLSAGLCRGGPVSAVSCAMRHPSTLGTKKGPNIHHLS